MAQSRRDENFVTTIIGVSSVDSETPTLIAVNPTTKAVLAEITSMDHGKTLLSVGGQVSGLGNNTLVSAGTKRLKVYAFVSQEFFVEMVLNFAHIGGDIGIF